MSDPIYTEIIIDEAKNAHNVGTIENPDISQHDANPISGKYPKVMITTNLEDDYLK